MKNHKMVHPPKIENLKVTFLNNNNMQTSAQI